MAQWVLATVLGVVWAISLLYSEWIQFWLRPPSCSTWPDESVQVSVRVKFQLNVPVLGVVWTISLLYSECIQFWLRPPSCSTWPDESVQEEWWETSGLLTTNRFEVLLVAGCSIQVEGQYIPPKEYKTIAVISSPKLLPSTALHAQFITARLRNDLYLRRAFRASVLRFSPSLVVTLGDLFQSGADATYPLFRAEASRYHHESLGVGAGRAVVGSWHLGEGGVNVHMRTDLAQVAGERDVGFSSTQRKQHELAVRFERYVGALNFHDKVGAVKVVGVNGLAMDGHRQRNNSTKQLEEFLQSLPDHGEMMCYTPSSHRQRNNSTKQLEEFLQSLPDHGMMNFLKVGMVGGSGLPVQQQHTV
ncbi:unnamed protein product [Closterium sp. Yama58-4]|nr:unnamed protein product [Closterium sp. Yama58-4]